MAGPEYISILAGEVMNPRKTLRTAFKTLYWRFGIFFVGGAIAVGIVIPYNDKTLVDIVSGKVPGHGGAGASPYVIAMANMGIPVLPHIVTALLITSIFSAGNSYVYTSSRSLYSLSLDGHAPKFLQKCTKSGVPIYCFGVAMLFTLISLLSLGKDAAVVISWYEKTSQFSLRLELKSPSIQACQPCYCLSSYRVSLFSPVQYSLFYTSF